MATMITVDPAARIGPIHPWLFGSFIEHMQRCVYGGIYEPDSPLSDEYGFRLDVLEAMRELSPTHLRYPGGNFVSGYHWRDGIGPREQRPVRYEQAWGAVEPNIVGTHEFMSYCRRLDATPHFCVNLGSGTPEEAADWVEYCNATHDTTLTRLRAANGASAPFSIPLWGLGNEIYGPWQIGVKKAVAYADVALEAALRIRSVDPTVRLIACGWENSQQWNATVLEVLAPHVDYLSVHLYIGVDDYLTALAQPLLIERLSREHSALADLICRELGLTKRIPLAFDEWNVAFVEQSYHDIYTLKDGLAIASCLNALIRCADVVTLANQSMPVNVGGPIYTRPDGLLRQATYWPLQLYRRVAGHLSLRPTVTCEGYRARYSFRTWSIDEEVPYLDVGAALAPDGRTITLGVVNRHPDVPIAAELRLVGARAASECVSELVTASDAQARNTFEQPDRVRVQKGTWTANTDWPTYTFPPHALTMLTIPLR